MTRFIAACICALVLLSSTINAEARQRHKASSGLHPMCNVTMPCLAPYNSSSEQARVTRGRYVAKSFGFGAAIEKRPARKGRHSHAGALDFRGKIVDGRDKVVRYTPDPRAVVAATVSGIVGPLAAKVSEIQSACGSKVISARRRTYIAGTRHMSLHASGQAVDMAGNPGCIYSLLHGWAGGYSTDYGRMAHVHISWGGPEHGLRFAHGGGARKARRYAKHRHRHHRYAAAR